MNEFYTCTNEKDLQHLIEENRNFAIQYWDCCIFG